MYINMYVAFINRKCNLDSLAMFCHKLDLNILFTSK